MPAQIIIKPVRDSFLGKQGKEFSVEFVSNGRVALRARVLRGDLPSIRAAAPVAFPRNARIIRRG